MQTRRKCRAFSRAASPVDFSDGKHVITMKGKQVLCSPLRFDTSSLTPCNHEEADTTIMVHAADASKAGTRTSSSVLLTMMSLSSAYWHNPEA